ncbi:MAG TPA: hypothetical protein VK014_11470 [Cyclobacteriaceae bacterium]|nr:hypothetical protein [Cyclobacteriaceae bacterium]
MTDINDMLNRLFGGDQPVLNHKENIRYPEEAHEQIIKWMASADGKQIFREIRLAYHLKNAGLEERPEIYLLNSPYANGFALAYNEMVTEKTFSNLFFAFGARMLDLGYYRVSLDRTIREEGDGVKISEKQYFKPLVHTDTDQKVDQLFGNVSIEKELIDNRPRYLKVLVTVYSDQHYQDACSFAEFMEELFNL